jgi:hypothetical protein
MPIVAAVLSARAEAKRAGSDAVAPTAADVALPSANVDLLPERIDETAVLGHAIVEVGGRHTGRAHVAETTGAEWQHRPNLVKSRFLAEWAPALVRNRERWELLLKV